jgi:hypothetical protein
LQDIHATVTPKPHCDKTFLSSRPVAPTGDLIPEPNPLHGRRGQHFVQLNQQFNELSPNLKLFRCAIDRPAGSLCLRFAEHCNRYWCLIFGWLAEASRAAKEVHRQRASHFECDQFATLDPA